MIDILIFSLILIEIQHKITNIQDRLQAVATSKAQHTCDPISNTNLTYYHAQPIFSTNQHRVFT